METWKDIVFTENGVTYDYTGLYKINTKGQIYSLISNKILKNVKANTGYYQITLCKNKKHYQHLIHRLVAFMFIPNPNNLPQVNHIDENKGNNTLENLEWCDAEYNNNHGTRNERVSVKQQGEHNSMYGKTHDEQWKTNMSKRMMGENNHKSKKVMCVNTGEIFGSASQGARWCGLKKSESITKCCKGIQEYAGKHPITKEKLCWKWA